MSLKATFGSLAAAGMVAAPTTVFIFTFLLLLPSDSHIFGKIALPFLGAGAVFTLGWLVSIPLAICLGGSTHWFMRKVGYRAQLAYQLSGPVVGLVCAMTAHVAMPDVIGEMMGGGWPTFAFLLSWLIGGIVLMTLFWRIRRPDRPWDDVADRRRAGEDV